MADEREAPAAAAANNNKEAEDNNTGHSHKIPMHIWAVLVAALVAVSSAATVFRLVGPVGPLTKASWRQQAAVLVGLPPFIHQFRALPQADKLRFISPASVGLIFASGFALAIHFGSWVWSLDLTSLPHSVLFVSSTPVIVAVGLELGHRLGLLPHSISRLEAGGVALAMVGMIITMFDLATDSSVTILGDAVALLGAVAMAVYMTIGSHLRSWMPVFVYSVPVNAVSVLVTAVTAALAKEPQQHPQGTPILFGWFQLSFLFLYIYMAIGPGIVGHTGINYALSHASPLIVSVLLLLEPLVGSIIGALVGVSALPGLYTLIGGPILITAAVIVTYGSDKRLASQEDRSLTSAAAPQPESEP